MPRRAAPSTYAEMVRDPLYHEAEERVYNWLISKGKCVTDDRARHTFHDFTVGSAWTLDVKCDTYAHSNGRVAWEQGIIMGSKVVDGWGQHPGLDYIVWVLLPAEDQRENKWPIILCPAKKVRELVYENRETPPVQGFMTRPGDRQGFGYTIDINWLRENDGILEEDEV